MEICFRKILIIALSAIFISNVLDYIRKSLYLYTLTCYYEQSLDRSNITLMIYNITKLGFEDLDFLIPKSRLIPKIIVFINKINEGIVLTTCLYNLSPSK